MMGKPTDACASGPLILWLKKLISREQADGRRSCHVSMTFYASDGVYQLLAALHHGLLRGRTLSSTISWFLGVRGPAASYCCSASLAVQQQQLLSPPVEHLLPHAPRIYACTCQQSRSLIFLNLCNLHRILDTRTVPAALQAAAAAAAAATAAN